MRRAARIAGRRRVVALIAGALIALALVAVALLAPGGLVAAGAGSADSAVASPYLVRAIFDDASFAVVGEDVRIAGAPVGSIRSLAVTADKHAAVTLAIDDAAFAPFHADAQCTIRPQSLIGEEYVDCDPGTAAAPALQRIASGPGAGSYLLPVTRTSSPIDFDIVQDIYQEPVRESLAVLLDEFGTGLAARGSDLNAVIHRANPALGYTDQVLAILARQNRALAQLATDSDAVLAPLARARGALSDFVVQANATSVASAARAAQIERTLQLLPSSLRQLRPLMSDLGALADQGTPLMTDLGQSASGLDRELAQLTPFAGAARTALTKLGAAAAASQPALQATVPLAHQLQRLGAATAPSAASLDQLTASLERTGAIQQLMKVLFYGTTATNGFDSDGHYVRDELLVGSCTGYFTSPVPSCSAKFAHDGTAADATAADGAAAAASPASPASAGSLTGLLNYLIGGHR
ncbi:MAG: MlaD family protein [Solirubrobacteraceae bacterium]|jgi:ABC-type transporter Mla subunit MlaD